MYFPCRIKALLYPISRYLSPLSLPLLVIRYGLSFPSQYHARIREQHGAILAIRRVPPTAGQLHRDDLPAPRHRGVHPSLALYPRLAAHPRPARPHPRRALGEGAGAVAHPGRHRHRLVGPGVREHGAPAGGRPRLDAPDGDTGRRGRDAALLPGGREQQGRECQWVRASLSRVEGFNAWDVPPRSRGRISGPIRHRSTRCSPR